MAFEDFTTYTEVDTGGKLSETSSRVTFASMNNDAATYLYKDKTAGFFSAEFKFNADIKLTAITNGSGNHGLVMLVNDLAVLNTNLGGNKPQVGILIGDESGTDYLLYACEINGGNQNLSSASASLAENTTYFCQITRDESIGTFGTLYLDIYPTDADRTAKTNIISALSLALSQKVDFRYVMGVQNYSSAGGGANVSGYIENLDLSIITNRTLVMSLGSYTLTGIAIAVGRTIHIVFTNMSFVLSGIAVNIKKGKRIIMALGSFILTGNALLIYKKWVNKTKNTVMSLVNKIKTPD